MKEAKLTQKKSVLTSAAVFAVALMPYLWEASPAMAGSMDNQGQKLGNLVLDDFGYFFAGGNYVPCSAHPGSCSATSGPNEQIRDGQIYVEYFVPANKSQKYPVVMIHGGGQTGTNFLKTPDGRDGWAQAFIREGYTVYVIDQPVRGRSVYHPTVDGPISGNTALRISQLFTAPQDFPPSPTQSQGWPQAKFHTQWPGTGLQGDPAFDQFYASQVESAGNAEALNQAAVSALLDKIGPAIIMTHSQSGPFGWDIAEKRPTLVKAILAAEPSGPPFVNAALPWGAGGTAIARPYGVTMLPMTYDPPITNPNQLQTQLIPSPDPSNLDSCTQQVPPARRLVNLLNIPVLMFTSQASYHAGYDYCTAQYLKDAGVPVDYVKLADVGLKGGAHMIMLEKYNAKVAAFMLGWLKDQFKDDHGDHH